MGIGFGILAAVLWGAGDLLITQVTRRFGTDRAMVYIQSLSLAGWAALLLISPHSPGSAVSIWLVALGAGICHVLGLKLTYRAFEIGTLSLVSPIASGFAIVTGILALATGSEKPPILAISGAVLLVAGIVLATYTPHGQRRPSLAGVPEAIGSSLAFGAMFWMMDVFVTPSLGFIWPLLLLKTMATGSSLLSLITSRATTPATAAVPDGAAMAVQQAVRPSVLGLFVLGAAATDTLAWIAWMAGTRTEYATVVTALASLFSVVTILLAWAFLHDRLTRSQWQGVAVILLGILLVSV